MDNIRDISVPKSPPVLCCAIHVLTDYIAFNNSAFRLTDILHTFCVSGYPKATDFPTAWTCAMLCLQAVSHLLFTVICAHLTSLVMRQ
jgi:hypothetical protein